MINLNWFNIKDFPDRCFWIVCAVLQLGNKKIGKKVKNIFTDIQTGDLDFAKSDTLTAAL